MRKRIPLLRKLSKIEESEDVVEGGWAAVGKRVPRWVLIAGRMPIRGPSGWGSSGISAVRRGCRRFRKERLGGQDAAVEQELFC
ncbi:hypothetical protein [Streptomyces sp. MAA16]|uniref:hypothetical protein n=1 Tax=Streptomyces sp. MAA16 TaxID=3035116 RepID=UPI00247420FC|nr:hypothetical protein [Streptomyces sp. MAA16]